MDQTIIYYATAYTKHINLDTLGEFKMLIKEST